MEQRGEEPPLRVEPTRTGDYHSSCDLLSDTFREPLIRDSERQRQSPVRQSSQAVGLALACDADKAHLRLRLPDPVQMVRLALALLACSFVGLAGLVQTAVAASGLRCSDEPQGSPVIDATPPRGDYNLRLDYKGPLGVVAPEFLSVTFDANSITFDFDRMPWTSDPGLVAMAAELQPMYLRFGGTEADWIHYAVDQREDPTPEQISEWSQ